MTIQTYYLPYRQYLCNLFVILIGFWLQGCSAAAIQSPIVDVERAVGETMAREIVDAMNGAQGTLRVRSMVSPNYFVLGWYKDGQLSLVLLDTGQRLMQKWENLGQTITNGREFASFARVMQFKHATFTEAQEAIFMGSQVAVSWLAQYTSLELMPILTLTGFEDLPYEFLPPAGVLE